MARTCQIAMALLALYAVIYGVAATFHGWEWQHGLASAVLAPLLVVLTTIDLSSFRLPDPLTLLLFVAGVAVAVLTGVDTLPWNLVAAGLGASGLYVVARLYRHVRGRPGLGLGDAKLYGAGGMWVGLDGLTTVLLVACLSALGAVGVAVLAGRKIEATTPLPFGPFLCFGIWTTWCFGPAF